DVGPEPFEPGGIPAQLPVAIGLQYIAELAIDARPKARNAGAERQVEPERHAAGFRQLVVAEIHFPHRPLEIGKEEGHDLLVIPDMRATAFAGAGIRMAAFPAVERAVLEP